jgi:signal transduction histidine kinase
MAEYLFPLAFLIVIYVLIIGFLVRVYSRNKNIQPSLFRLISVRKSIIEQKLVLEALSASSREKELGAIIRSIGTYASGLLGYEQWILWLRKGDNSFVVADFQVSEEIENPSLLFNSHDPGLYHWVRSNAMTMLITGKITELARSSEMLATLNSMKNGIIIPFIEADKLHGFIAVGGSQKGIKRSEQFLSLFGAMAAVLIRKAMLDAKEKDARRKQLQAESMASLGKLAAGLAHEIKNPLTFIRSSSEYLNEQYQLKEDDRELAAGVLEEIDRINKRVEELLTLARVDVDSFEMIDIGQLLEKNLKQAALKASEAGIELRQINGLEETFIKGNNDKLTQLLQNLILNALEAMPENGKLEINAVKKDDQVEISVRDNGHGIPDEIKNTVFQPFFTTKDKGTGLGLAISYSIARAHSGKLELVRSDDKGTEFCLTIPQAKRG